MNNVTEYEACIVGLQVALEFGSYDLSVFGDSLLIISQIEEKWQAETLNWFRIRNVLAA